VEPSGIDRDGYHLAARESRVRRELRDEVRPRASDDRRFLVLVRRRRGIRGERVRVRIDPEVRDRAAAERLDELDAASQLRQVRSLGRGVVVARANAHDDGAAVLRPQPPTPPSSRSRL
jgi:hypothetical protein